MRIEDMAAPVVQALLADAGIEAARVDEVILANALGAGGNPARRAALLAGLPERVAGLTIDRQCAGGLDAVLLAQALVDSGAADVVLAGGAESYSLRPLRALPGPDGVAVPYDQAPFTPWPARDPEMGAAAAALADRLGLDRVAQADWAVESHAKARAVTDWPEIVPVAGVLRDAFTRDLTPALARRAPQVAGSITAATAAVAADAAAFVLVVSDRIAAGRAGLRIVTGATLGGTPEEPGLVPIAAIAAALGRAGLQPGDLAMAEVMEAYAVQAMACVNGAGLPVGIVNRAGGALARGHPIGASGAILAVRLFHGLPAGYGLAAIAAAGGLGSALVVAR